MPNRSIQLQDNVSVAATSTNENLLTGQTYIRPPFPALGNLILNVSDADLRYELYVNGRAVTDLNRARVQAAGTLEVPDDMQVSQFWCPQGGQLLLRAINDDAAAQTVNYRIDLEESFQPQPAELVTQLGPISIAANAQNDNLVADLRFERPRVDSYLDVYASASAAGIELELTIDGNRVAQPSPVQPSNRVPINPYDLLLSGIEAPQGGLIQLTARNTTAGALNVFFRTVLSETQYIGM